MSNPNWPSIDVIVPVYNEAATIRAKLSNLAKLDYPRDCLHVLVVDGGSNDGTAELVERWNCPQDFRVEVLRTEAVGKPAQMTAGLGRTRTDWVLVTDADAQLPDGLLKSMVKLAQANGSVGLVGTPIHPMSDDPFDWAHWTMANWLRRLERKCGTAGLVVGPCYLARRELLAVLGWGTVADDVYVSCRALLGGHRIELTSLPVRELRAPVGGRELFRHKLRKAMGYVRETARALPHAEAHNFATSAMFFWRAGLLIGLPVALWGSVAGAVASFGWSHTSVAVVILLVAFWRLTVRGARDPLTRAAAIVATPLLTAVVLTAAILLLLFVPLSARYRKVSLAEVSLLDTDPP
jgi:cellulose synthase/poly-beta-1,6-N-acetylglucosamine synthase-like glycosyltransferase